MEQQQTQNFDEQLDNLYWSLYHLDRQVEQLTKEQLTDLGKRLKGIELDGTVDLILQQACQQNQSQLADLAKIKAKLLAQQSVIIRKYLPPAELASLLPRLASHLTQKATASSGIQVVSQQSDMILNLGHNRAEHWPFGFASNRVEPLHEEVQKRLWQVFRVPMTHSYAHLVTPHSPGRDNCTLSLQAVTRHYFEAGAQQRVIELSANPNWFIQLAWIALQTHLCEPAYRSQGKLDEFTAVTLENVNKAALSVSFPVRNWTDFAQPLQDWPESLKFGAILSGALLLDVSARGNSVSAVINPIFALQRAAKFPEPPPATGNVT